MPSVPGGYSAENGRVWKLPDSLTVPLASSLGPSATPATVLPETVKVASPLSFVIWVPGGNVSVEPSEPRWRIGSSTGAANWSVYENPADPKNWMASLTTRGGEK